ncbi:transposase [Actinacidiphila acidipaludis]|uniref:transposase n=1 Tax=Actinacidiphila acidipaludis TaxID=2873382 RepID=UPI00223BB266|nr:transposase [Streptomyces acidipaludis]
MEGRGGQPEGYCHRQMVDTVRYLVAGGTTWRAMPADFPAWDGVYESVPPHRHHRPGHRTSDRHRPDVGSRDRGLSVPTRLPQNLPDRLTSDHQPLPRGLRLPHVGLEDLHPPPGSTLTLFQQPQHRRHTAPPTKRRHEHVISAAEASPSCLLALPVAVGLLATSPPVPADHPLVAWSP